MGFMSKMRDHTGVVLWILIIAFGIIFMLQDTDVFSIIGQTGTAIAKVNGQEVSLEDYTAVVQGQLQRIRQNSDEDIPPQTEDLINEQVYMQMVDDRLRQQEMDRLGLVVTPSEIRDMVFGPNPHPAIADYFRGADGQIDRELLNSFAQNQANTEWWVGVEQYLEAERRREKLDNLLASTVRVSDQQVEDYYRQQNLTVSADYAALQYAAVPDSTIIVGERELRRYYDENRPEFERKASRVVEYVAIPRQPTPADTASVLEELRRVADRFSEADDDSVFLARHYSARPFADVAFRRDELNSNLADAVFADLTVGRVVGPLEADGFMHLVKIVAVEPAEEKSVKARHILKRAAEGDEEAKNAAREAILELRRRIRAGESFPEIAAAESDDVVSGAEGGDLGWFGPGGMVEAFEDAAFDAQPGEVVGPVETQFGYHLIQVEDVSNQAVRVADMALRIRTTPATLTRIREDLDDLKYFAEEEGNFREEVERRSMSVETVEIEDDQQFIPDIGNSRTLQNFLESAGVGDISEPIELNDKFIIARLVETKRAGFRPFQEVRAELEPRVRTEARKDAQVAKLRAALQSVGRDLDAIALAVGTSVQTASDVALANPVVPGLGREAAFVCTAAGLSSGDVSGGVAGNTAAFVLRRTDTETETTLTDSQRAGIRQQLETQQRNQLRAQWIAELRESADIVDNRRFFLR